MPPSDFQHLPPGRGHVRRQRVVASITDNRYDKPFKFLPKLGAYLVTLQDMTATLTGMWDVVPDGGDRALPKGIIEKEKKSKLYHIYLYQPDHAARYDKALPLGTSTTLEEAVAAIVAA